MGLSPKLNLISKGWTNRSPEMNVFRRRLTFLYVSFGIFEPPCRLRCGHSLCVSYPCPQELLNFLVSRTSQLPCTLTGYFVVTFKHYSVIFFCRFIRLLHSFGFGYLISVSKNLLKDRKRRWRVRGMKRRRMDRGAYGGNILNGAVWCC